MTDTKIKWSERWYQANGISHLIHTCLTAEPNNCDEDNDCLNKDNVWECPIWARQVSGHSQWSMSIHQSRLVCRKPSLKATLLLVIGFFSYSAYSSFSSYSSKDPPQPNWGCFCAWCVLMIINKLDMIIVFVVKLPFTSYTLLEMCVFHGAYMSDFCKEWDLRRSIWLSNQPLRGFTMPPTLRNYTCTL